MIGLPTRSNNHKDEHWLENRLGGTEEILSKRIGKRVNPDVWKIYLCGHTASEGPWLTSS